MPNANNDAGTDVVGGWLAIGGAATAACTSLVMGMPGNASPGSPQRRRVDRPPGPTLGPAAVTSPKLDIVAIGDAIVDVIATCDDDFIAERGLQKGSMRLLDAAEADELYEAMRPAREI